jgi:hypothetical protein
MFNLYNGTRAFGGRGWLSSVISSSKIKDELLKHALASPENSL